MRTTITLDPDTETLVKQLMNDRALSFKEAVNEAIRRGLGRSSGTMRPFRTTTFSMGWNEAVSVDRALTIAAELEDEELARRVRARK